MHVHRLPHKIEIYFFGHCQLAFTSRMTSFSLPVCSLSPSQGKSHKIFEKCSSLSLPVSFGFLIQLLLMLFYLFIYFYYYYYVLT